jgi:hypothetical protein
MRHPLGNVTCFLRFLDYRRLYLPKASGTLSPSPLPSLLKARERLGNPAVEGTVSRQRTRGDAFLAPSRPQRLPIIPVKDLRILDQLSSTLCASVSQASQRLSLPCN